MLERHLDYITIATLATANDFDDLTVARFDLASASNITRGVFAGGAASPFFDTMDYITIASLAVAQDFGDLADTRRGLAGCSGG